MQGKGGVVAQYKLVDEDGQGSLFESDVDLTPDLPECTESHDGEGAAGQETDAELEAVEHAETLSVATAESNPDSLVLPVDNRPKSGHGSIYEVVVYAPGPLFLRLKHDRPRELMLVNSFDPTPEGNPGPVEATGRVSVGDIFLSINDIPIDNRSLGNAAAVIKAVSAEAAQNGMPRVLRFHKAKSLTSSTRTTRLHDPEKERARSIQQTCDEKFINQGRLRNLASQGVPENPSLRGMVWRILLDYLPLDTSLWTEVLERKRKLYAEWVEELLTSPAKVVTKPLVLPTDSPATVSRKSAKLARALTGDDPLNTGTASEWARYWADLELLDEIEKDVIRTHPEIQFFLEDHDHVRYNAMQRALFVYAKLNPGVRYVQGMNELLGTLYYVFATDQTEAWSSHAEADAFFCFSNLMLEVQDVFIRNLDDSSSGIQGRIMELSNLLLHHDPELHHYLQAQQLEPSYYALRWITTLLSREFNLPDTIRVWDSIFSDTNRNDFLVYACCTMLIVQRRELLEGDFVNNLRLLQSYPPTDVQIILDRANSLRTSDISRRRTMASKAQQQQQQKENGVIMQLSDFMQRTLAATQDAYGKVASYRSFLEEGERGSQPTSYATLASWLTNAAGNQPPPQLPKQQDYIHLKRTRRKPGDPARRRRSPRNISPRSANSPSPTPASADMTDQSDAENAAESEQDDDHVSFTETDDDDGEQSDSEDPKPKTLASPTSHAPDMGNSLSNGATKPVLLEEALSAAMHGLDVSTSVDNLISELDGILGHDAPTEASFEEDVPKDGASEMHA